MRVFAAALLVCMVTFLAGVAGDLSLVAQAAPQYAPVYADSGQFARVRLPPPLLRTASAEAAPMRAPTRPRLRPIATPHVFEVALILEPKAIALAAKAPAKPIALAEAPGKSQDAA